MSYDVCLHKAFHVRSSERAIGCQRQSGLRHVMRDLDCLSTGVTKHLDGYLLVTCLHTGCCMLSNFRERWSCGANRDLLCDFAEMTSMKKAELDLEPFVAWGVACLKTWVWYFWARWKSLPGGSVVRVLRCMWKDRVIKDSCELTFARLKPDMYSWNKVGLYLWIGCH